MSLTSVVMLFADMQKRSEVKRRSEITDSSALTNVIHLTGYLQHIPSPKHQLVISPVHLALTSHAELGTWSLPELCFISILSTRSPLVISHVSATRGRRRHTAGRRVVSGVRLPSEATRRSVCVASSGPQLRIS